MLLAITFGSCPQNSQNKFQLNPTIIKGVIAIPVLLWDPASRRFGNRRTKIHKCVGFVYVPGTSKTNFSSIRPLLKVLLRFQFYFGTPRVADLGIDGPKSTSALGSYMSSVTPEQISAQSYHY